MRVEPPGFPGVYGHRSGNVGEGQPALITMDRMQTTEEYTPEVPLAEPPANVEVVNWPVKDEPSSAWAVLAVCLLISLGVGWLGQSPIMTLVALGSFGVALWRVWIPVRFELSPKGVVETVFRRKRRVPWSSIKRCQIRRAGVLLLPTKDSSPISLLSGIYLSWGDQKEALLSCINHYLGSRAESSVVG